MAHGAVQGHKCLAAFLLLFSFIGSRKKVLFFSHGKLPQIASGSYLSDLATSCVVLIIMLYGESTIQMENCCSNHKAQSISCQFLCTI